MFVAVVGIGGVSLISLNTQLDEDKIVAGFTEVLTELHRAKVHGFTDSELHRAKLNLLEAFERHFEALPTRRSRQIQEDILDHLLLDAPLSGIAFEFDLAKYYLPDIKVNEVNVEMEGLLDFERSLLLLTGPDKENLVLPEVDEVQSVLEQVAAQTLSAYVDDLVTGGRLLEEIPQPVGYLQKSYDERLDLTILNYENGVTALLKPTELEENRITFDFASKGGHSRVNDESYFAASLVSQVSSESGAGPHDFDTLDSLLTGQTVKLSPYLNETTEGYSGSSATEDLETLFQLAHLKIEQPRFNEDPFLNVLDNQRVVLRNRELDPFYQFFLSIQNVLYGEALREQPMTLANLEAIEFEDARQVHDERLKSLDSPLMTLVGDFELEDAIQWTNTYIGSLPLAFSEENWEDRTVRAEPGPVKEEIYFGQASQVVVVQTYINDDTEEMVREDRNALSALSRILDIRYDQQLREDLGGTYFTSANVSVQRVPRPRASLTVFFATNEQQVESLTEASRSILQDILDNGVTAEETNTAKVQMIHDLENSQSTNGYWRSVLRNEFIFENGQLDLIDKGKERIESITQEQINQLAPMALNVDALIEIVQFPESSKPTDNSE